MTTKKERCDCCSVDKYEIPKEWKKCVPQYCHQCTRCGAMVYCNSCIESYRLKRIKI